MRGGSGVDLDNRDLDATQLLKFSEVPLGVSGIKRIHNERVVTCSGMLFQDLQRRREVTASLVGAVCGDGIKSVGDRNNPHQQWNLITPDAVRVAGAVERLVMPANSWQRIRKL